MKALKTIVLMAITIAATFFLTRHYFAQVEVDIVTEHDTVYRDTGSVVTVHPDPEIVYRDTGSIKKVKVPVDSAKLVEKYLALHKDFYTKNIYQDTLKDDTSALVVIRDTVYMNELKNRGLIFANRRPTTIKKTTNIYDQTRWYAGAQAGPGNIQTMVILHTKKGFNFSVGYDLAGKDKGVRLGVYYELGNK
jgi:hypothetical protein